MLERFLIPLLEQKYFSKPWAPLIYSLIILLNARYKVDRHECSLVLLTLPIPDSAATTSIPQLLLHRMMPEELLPKLSDSTTSTSSSSESAESSKRVETLAKTLMGHVVALGVSRLSIETCGHIACFLGELLLSYDVPLLRHVGSHFVSEALLRPLLEDCEANGNVHKELQRLMKHFNTPNAFLHHKTTRTDFFLSAFVISVDVGVTKMRSYLRSPGYLSKHRMAILNTVCSVADVLRMMVDATSQATTGRYVSWVIAFWSPHQNRADISRLEATGWVMQNILKLVRDLIKQDQTFPGAKLLLETLQALALNVGCFLPRSNGNFSHASLPSYVLDDISRLGVTVRDSLEAMPDTDFLRKVLTGDGFFPRLNMFYLNFQDYLRRNFQLCKADVTASLWDEVSRNHSNIHQVLSVSLSEANSSPVVTIKFSPGSNLQFHGGVDSDALNSFQIRCAFLVQAEDMRASIQYFCGIQEITVRNNGCNDTDRLPVMECEGDSAVLSLLRQGVSFRYLLVPNPAGSAVLEVLSIHGDTIRRFDEQRNTVPAQPWLEDIVTGHLSPTEIRAAAAEFPDICGDTLVASDLPSSINFFGCMPEVQQVSELITALSSHYKRIHMSLDVKGATICVKDTSTSPSQKHVIPLLFQDEGRPAIKKLYSAQAFALMSSLFRRVTVLIGPPGSGKTEVTSRIIQSISFAHSSPLPLSAIAPGHRKHRILLVTQSNHALDQLLVRLGRLGVTAVRLGKQGRDEESRRFTVDGWIEQYERTVTHFCATERRKAKGPLYRLISQLKQAGTSYVTMKAHLLRFWDSSVGPRAERLSLKSATAAQLQFFVDSVGIDCVPTTSTTILCLVVNDFLQQLRSLYQALDVLAISYWKHRRQRLLELAEVTAVTCSGAAIYYDVLCTKEGICDTSRGINYETVVLEEAGKVLEVESAVILSQHLRRLILVGDDCQLRSLVLHPVLRLHSNLPQSLFARLLRIGIQPITLNQQARARSCIADLYRWRYDGLIDHPCTTTLPSIPFLPNAVNFVNVEGCQIGETNKSEADFVSSVCEFLCFKGIPPETITVITPYRAQNTALRR